MERPKLKTSLTININKKQQSTPLGLIPTPPQSPYTRKRKTTFLTQKQLNPYQKFLQIHSQLNQYIDVLDQKIQKIIQKQQGQFMLAYRNHLKRVRQQMQQIRRKALTNADSSVSQFQKIQVLQKQLQLFRQQSLKLFQKINQKNKQMEQLIMKIDQLSTQKQFMQCNIKKLMKRNKYLQGLNLQIKQQIVTDKIQQEIKRKQSGQKNSTKGDQFRPFTTGLPSRGASLRTRNQSIQISNKPDQLYSQIRSILGNTETSEKIIKLVEQNNQNSASRFYLPNKLQKTQLPTNGIVKNTYSMKSKSFAIKSQMQQFFLKCIETVRKQIFRRKQAKNINFYLGTTMSIQQFKKIDMFKLLQLIVSHDNIIKSIYKILFESK